MYLLQTPKRLIDVEISKIIKNALKSITIPDLASATRRSLIAFYNEQYNTLSRINGSNLLLLLAYMKLTDKDNKLVKNMPLERARRIVETYSPISIYGQPMQKYSEEYIKENVKPIFDRLIKQFPKDPDDISGHNSLRNRAEMEVRYNGHQEQIEELKKITNLVIASSHADCSDRCRKWQSRVYSLNGTYGTTDDGRKYVPLEVATDVYYTTKVGKVYKNGLLGFNCYDDKTEIYTSEGWKLFKDLNKTEYIYTLNPDTRETEWQKPINYYKSHTCGEMVRFKSATLDLLVTPNHSMLYYTKKDSRLRFKFASECSTATFFTAGHNWNAEDVKSITIGKIQISGDMFCRLMAYYLADGSLHSKTAIKIAQKDNDKMWKSLEELPFTKWRDNDKIVIHSKDLVKYVKRFGVCNEKYVPEIIKQMSKRQLKIFLDAYLDTDGHRAKESFINGHKRRPHLSLFTTSKKMSDDLGEIALKAGYRPKFDIMANKGKQVQFKNGKYTQNYDVYIIHLNYNVNVTHYTKTYEKYEGEIYCVEVPNHTVLVRRNGRVIWCGNCRHYLTPYKKGYKFPKPSAKEEAKQYKITERQRYLERKVREYRTKALYNRDINKDEYLKFRKKSIDANKEYIKYSRDNNRAYYPSRTKIL